jgi:hypothetical protein
MPHHLRVVGKQVPWKAACTRCLDTQTNLVPMGEQIVGAVRRFAATGGQQCQGAAGLLNSIPTMDRWFGSCPSPRSITVATNGGEE